MKKFAVILLSLLAFVLAGCGPMYSIKRDKKGIYRTSELEYNSLATDKGDWGDVVVFNLCKYVYGSNTFFSVKIGYNYPEKGMTFNILGASLGGSMFGIKKRNGVLICVNGGKTVALKYKSLPTHQVFTTTNGMSQSRTHIETVECILSPQWISYLVNAKSIVITLVGGTDPDPAKEKKLEYYFKDDNFKIIRQFYDEEVRNKI